MFFRTKMEVVAGGDDSGEGVPEIREKYGEIQWRVARDGKCKNEDRDRAG